MKKTFKNTLNFMSKPAPFIGLLVVISTFFRSIFLTKADIWHDEGYSTMIINYPLSEIITRTINDVHPPLYYLILSIWQGVFGASVISLRGFSVVCGVLTVVLLYLLMRKLFNEKIAKVAAIFAAIGPFLVRYSDEARMYALAALLAVAATYLLVTALAKTTKRRYLWWAAYGVIVALGLYTQYFFIFIIPAHIIYTLGTKKWKITDLLKDRGWWLGNLLAAGLFLPWLPVMIAQTTRVQGGFWIPPINLGTIPNTISQFIYFGNEFATIFGYSLIAAMVIIPVLYARKTKKQLNQTRLLATWLTLPMIFVAALSLGRPVYIDRYFTYSAPAFYALLSVFIYTLNAKRHTWIRPSIIATVMAIFAVGTLNVASAATHKMGEAADFVNRNFQQGDMIVSAELYTFFDLSYYNQTGSQVNLLSSKPFGKYGEMSLLHDKQHLRVANFEDITAKRVWVVGKTGEHDYFSEKIPGNWTHEEQFEAGDSAVRLYKVAQPL